MEDDVVIVTGAARGMGKATARRLARPGRLVMLVDRDFDALSAAREDLADSAGKQGFELAQVDVSDQDAVHELAARAASYGPVSVIAHAAGISPTMADWRTVMRIDFLGTANVLDAFLPLARPGTVVVCWASAAAYMAGVVDGDETIDAILDIPRAPDLLEQLQRANEKTFTGPNAAGAAYGWSKRGVIRLVRREAAAWGKRGARLVAVSPGIIDTPMSRFEYDTRAYMRDLVAGAPVPRMGTAEEVADLVAYLVSPNASFITGTDILIDGGCFSAPDQA
jgi:NAD(P)-dependent dehydrogenase (short-subunit alcohol dehydrogenase family)